MKARGGNEAGSTLRLEVIAFEPLNFWVGKRFTRIFPNFSGQLLFVLPSAPRIVRSLRQGLWIGGLRIPPGPEGSNGSLTSLVVVLWRTFFVAARN